MVFGSFAWESVAGGVWTVGWFVAGFVVAFGVGRFVVRPVVFWVLRSCGVGMGVRRSVRSVVEVVVVVVAGFVGLYAAGLGGVLRAVSVVAAAGTVVTGIVARDLVRNAFAGVFVVVNDDIAVGEWIEWGEYAGVVEAVSFRVTNVRTFSNEVVTVPNSVLVTRPVTNPVSNDRLRLECEFVVPGDADLGVVVREVRAVAAGLGEVAASPEPSVRTTDVGRATVTVTGRVWIREPSREKAVRVRSAFRAGVAARLGDEGVVASAGRATRDERADGAQVGGRDA